jgi:hypothetical protein
MRVVISQATPPIVARLASPTNKLETSGKFIPLLGMLLVLAFESKLDDSRNPHDHCRQYGICWLVHLPGPE